MENTETRLNSAPPENKMGVMPVNRLLLSMSIPMMISMLVQALYNIVDSIFVAQINENALTAVSLAFPIQNLLISVAVGTGVGVNALLSKSLGEKNFARANRTASNALFLAIASGLLFVIVGLTCVKPFYNMQTDVAEITNYGMDYLVICCVFSFGVFFQIMTERLMQSTGKAMFSMWIQMIGAALNLILDPILIFGLFGLPRLEVKGAAIATVAGQIIAGLIGIFLNIKFNKEITLRLKDMIPSMPIIKRIYSVGFPSIIMSCVGSIMVFGINKILAGFSTTAIAVFGVYFKLQSFIFMPVFGLNNGLVPIVAYNYGAKRGDRMLETIKYGIIYAVSIMIVGIIIFEAIPGPLLMMFDASENMLAIGIPCLRIICISFIFAGYCIALGSVFQAVGNGFLSMWVSVGRQLVVLLPVAYLLAQLGDVNLVWWAYPIAEIASLALTTVFMIRILKTKILPIVPKKEKPAEQ